MGRKLIYKPNSGELQRVLRTYDTFDRMKRQKEPFRAQADENEKRFRMDVSDRAGDIEPWQANLSIGWTYASIQAQLAMMSNTTIGWDLVPETERAEMMKGIWEDIMGHMSYVNNLSLRLPDQILESLIYGLGPAMVYYKLDKRTQKESLLADTIEKYQELLAKKEYKEKEVVVFKDACYEPFSFYDYFAWSNYEYLDTAPEAIRRYVMDFNEFKMIFKDYPGTKYVKSGGDTEWPEQYAREESLEDSQVEVLWHPNVQEDFLEIVANGVEVAYQPVPYRDDKGGKIIPFTVAINSKLPRMHWGRGEPDIMQYIEDEINTLNNLSIDASKMDLNKPILGEMEISQDQFYAKAPGQYLEVVDVNNIKELATEPRLRDAQIMIRSLEEAAIKITGTSENALSAISGKTATEVAILKEAVDSRIRYKIKRLENQCLSGVGKLFLAIGKEYYGIPDIVEITGQEELDDYVEYIQRELPDLMVDEKTVKKYPMIVGKDIENKNFSYVIVPEMLRGVKYRVMGKTESELSRAIEQDKINRAMTVLAAPMFAERVDWDAALDIYRLSQNLPNKIIKTKDKDQQQMIELAQRNAQMIERGMNVPVPQGVTEEYVMQLRRYFNSKELPEQILQIALQHIQQAEMQLGGQAGAQAGGGQVYPTAKGINSQAMQRKSTVKEQDVLPNFRGMGAA